MVQVIVYSRIAHIMYWAVQTSIVVSTQNQVVFSTMLECEPQKRTKTGAASALLLLWSKPINAFNYLERDTLCTSKSARPLKL